MDTITPVLLGGITGHVGRSQNLLYSLHLAMREGALLVNAAEPGEGQRIDASGLARELGSAVLANLVLLGLALREQVLFCSVDDCRTAIRSLAPARFVEQNLAALERGLAGDD